jgi:sugar phosphate isomerase/epimerase
MFKNFNPSVLGITGHQSEIIELALSFNFAGMDLNVVDFATRARLKGMPYARRLIDSAQIRLGTFQLPFDWEDDDERFQKDLKKLTDYSAAAAEIGCTRCVATLSPASDKRPYHENFEFHRKRLQEICKVLEPAGIRLGIGFQALESLRKNHPFQFIHDLDALTLLLNMVAAPNAGILLDVWDVVASGGSLEAVQKLPASQIVAVQVADMPATVPLNELEEKSRLLPGAEGGRIDMQAFLTILKVAGYDGPVTPRPGRGIFQTRKREVIAKQAGDAMDKVWKSAGLISEKRFVASAPDYDGEL